MSSVIVIVIVIDDLHGFVDRPILGVISHPRIARTNSHQQRIPVDEGVCVPDDDDDDDDNVDDDDDVDDNDDDEDDEDVDDDTYSTRLSQTPAAFDRFIASYSFRYSYCK